MNFHVEIILRFHLPNFLLKSSPNFFHVCAVLNTNAIATHVYAYIQNIIVAFSTFPVIVSRGYRLKLLSLLLGTIRLGEVVVGHADGDGHVLDGRKQAAGSLS